MIRLFSYLAVVSHDNGKATLHVIATSKKAVKKIIGGAEHCPDRAIEKIERITKGGRKWWAQIIQQKKH